MGHKRYVFPSLRSPRIVYTLHTDTMALWDQAYRARSVLWGVAGMFDTLGDGMTQHTHESVVPGDRLEDFCASAAAYLQTATLTAEDRETFGSYLFRFDERPAPDAISFALSVKYNAEKRAWYSLTERKVSRADSKQHDKRWHEVPAWADGSVQSAYNLLRGDGGRLEVLTGYALYEAVRDHVASHGGGYCTEGPKAFFNIEGTDVEQAYAALRLTLESLRAAEQARRVLACHLGNVERRPKAEAEAA